MKRRTLLLIAGAALLLLVVLLTLLFLHRKPAPAPAADPVADSAGFTRLLDDLVKACEEPTEDDARTIDADLAAIRAVNEGNYAVAQAIAEHWRRVWLDPDYRLCMYRGGDWAPELENAGIPDDGTHAIVVLGYELADGRMQPELEGRCEAAAAAARSLPSAILVCSGGATGANNPERHTEAGLMKDYLVERCGIAASRIFIDERAMTTEENAVNTFRILQDKGIRTVTVVTSSYHQRWGQAVYNALAALRRQQDGYSVEIVGGYSYDTEPTVEAYRMGARIAARQIAGILGLSGGMRQRP